MDETNWYLVNTQSGKERVAASRLRFFDIETLCPETLTVISNGYGRKYERARPLFPGYLFARCSLRAYGLAALSMRKEVLRFVSFGTGPAVVGDLLVDGIKSRIGADGYIVLDDAPERRRSACPFEPDQPVRITDGVWAGYTAIFKREIESAERVVLLMNVMSARREVQFPLGSVEPLTYAEAE